MPDKIPDLRISGHYPFQQYEPERVDLRALSLGAGVQSTRVLLGVLAGEYGEPGVDAPSCAIFADTGWEPKPVYEHLERLVEEAERVGFPVHIVQAVHPDGRLKNIRVDALNTATSLLGKSPDGRSASMPIFTRNTEGEAMMMRRQCTREYKIEPIERKVRELLGLSKGQRSTFTVESWQGISWDEMTRMRGNRTPWVWNRYPLIEQRETRADCIRYLEDRGWGAVKSACVGCPYRKSSEWLWLLENDPEGMGEAIALDEAAHGGILGWDRPAYLHRSLRPLSDVIPDLEILAEEEARQGDLFASGLIDECEGMCGV